MNTGAFDDLAQIVEVVARHGRLGARRRRVRAVGSGEPAAAASRRGRRAGRLVGDRRAQVAQRPLRLRASRSARTRRAHIASDGVCRRRTSRARSVRRRDADGLQPRVLSPRTRAPVLRRDPLARPGRASPISSSGCCDARDAASRSGLAALPGCEILNEVVLNQVLFRFDDDERDHGDPRRRVAERGRGMDERDRRGTAGPRFASRSRAGARRRRRRPHRGLASRRAARS